jgi:poly-gamma-glutamate synthesis protein (capsule biosynthesis protein)
MKKLLFLTILATAFINAKFSAKIYPITSQIKKRMIEGNSYRAGCPTSLKELRYIKLTYIGFDNKEHIGELIVNKAVANDVVNIFRELYDIKYPIRKMELVSKYNGSDFASIEADNTSAFNCRFVEGTRKWSNHSFGKAIDINPIENPYVSKSGHTSHKKSYAFVKRVRKNNTPPYKAMILKNDKIVKIFKKYGWRWGGDWRCCKDYQHFDKKN